MPADEGAVLRAMEEDNARIQQSWRKKRQRLLVSMGLLIILIIALFVVVSSAPDLGVVWTFLGLYFALTAGITVFGLYDFSCPRCGRRIGLSPWATFCPNCGARLSM